MQNLHASRDEITGGQKVQEPTKDLESVVQSQKEAIKELQDELVCKEGQLDALDSLYEQRGQVIEELQARVEQLEAELGAKGFLGTASAQAAQRAGVTFAQLWRLSSLGAFYFNSGSRVWESWSRAMVGAFGESIRPILPGLWEYARQGATISTPEAVRILGDKPIPSEEESRNNSLARRPELSAEETKQAKEPPAKELHEAKLNPKILDKLYNLSEKWIDEGANTRPKLTAKLAEAFGTKADAYIPALLERIRG